ncbi:MAG: HAD family phosphatase [Chlorobia bacterium]|nr:HAD family phosphatase [Fimbriimonadaceae bacterium]
MKTQLLAIDLDGTLLTRDKQIPTKAVEAIERARAAEVAVVLASGRIRPSMRKFSDQLDLSRGPMISGNGTHVSLEPTRDLLQEPLLPRGLEIISAYAVSNDIHLNIYTPTRLFFLKETPWGELYRERVETVVPEIYAGSLGEENCLKALIVDSPEKMTSHTQNLLAELAGLNIRATESEPEYLEFMSSTASKGSALVALAQALEVPIEATAAIGDYLNDLEMIQVAGISAAVSNAHPLVKDTANVVVSSNEEAGVAEFIDEFVLKLT